MFITSTDAALVIKDDQLAVLLRSNAALFTDASLKAQSEMEAYLRPRFDVATIFAETGSARHPALVMYATDMSLYHLHSAINPRNIPELRIDRYDQAIAWLKMVAKGELDPGLPPRVIPGSDAPADSTIAYDAGASYSTDW